MILLLDMTDRILQIDFQIPQMLPNGQKSVLYIVENYFLHLLKPPEDFFKTTYFWPVELTEGEFVIGTTTYIKKHLPLYTKCVLGHLEVFLTTLAVISF